MVSGRRCCNDGLGGLGIAGVVSLSANLYLDTDIQLTKLSFSRPHVPDRECVGGRIGAAHGPDAVQDFLAWGPKQDAVQQFRIVLDNEVPIAQIIARDSTVPALQDDRPTNEYFFFRRVSKPEQLRKITRQMLG
jgi:hypothetical protein